MVKQLLISALTLACSAATQAQAQPYPTRPLRIIVPFAPGGASDVIARILSLKLNESLGQAVVVDNRPGAGANIEELIELVRAQPGKHNFSSPGAGTTPHLSGEMFRLAFKIDLGHVPYNGAGPQIQSLLGAQVPIGFASAPSFAPQVKAGTLRGLAVTAEKRMALLPDVPAMGELGYKGMEADTFQGVFMPAGVPKAIVTRVHGDIVKAMATQDFRERLNAIAMTPVGNTPEEFTAQVKTDIARWGKVIRDSGIKVD